MKLLKPICKTTFFLLVVTTVLSCKNKSNSEVMLKLFNIKTSNQFHISVPDSLKEQCLIHEVIQTDSLNYAKGTFIDGKTGEKTTITVDYSKIATLNKNAKNSTFFIVPFTLSGVGTGYFKYIGLFELNHQSKSMNHNDTYFLGDRIILENMKYDGIEKLTVSIKRHSLAQAFSEKPKEIKILNFIINQTINLLKEN